MGAIVMLAGSEVRRRWRSVVVLTALVGFVGAVVLALTAGARRTDTSLARFEQFSRSATVEIDAGDATAAQIARFRRSRGVAGVGELYQLTLQGPGDQFLPVAAQPDRNFGTVIDRAFVVDGRTADPTKPGEITIGEALAARLRIGVGDRLRFLSYSPADVAQARAGNVAVPTPTGPHVTFRVVGIVRRPLDLGGRGAAGGVVVPTPAFLAQYRDRIGSFAGTLLRVRTERGTDDVPRVVRTAKQIFGGSPEYSVMNLAIEGQGAQNAIDVTTVGLYLAAGVAAVTGLVGIGIALSREIALADGDQLTLSALGLRPRHRVGAAAAVGLPVAVGGAVIALFGAVLASPLFPIGVAREADPDPGIRVDGRALSLAAVVLMLAVFVIALVAALRTARTAQPQGEPTRPAVAVRAVSELGAPPTVAAGMRFALDRGRRRQALPVRSSLLGATFGVAVVVAALVFSASLERLVTTPAAYGWTWDTTAGDKAATQQSENDCSPVSTRLRGLAVLSAVATVCNSTLEIGGRPVEGFGFGQVKGTIEPEAVAGRAPARATEVALGADTLAAAHRHVGDQVRIRGADRALTYRIVGKSVFVSASDSDVQPLADGVAFTAAGLARLGDADGGWNLVVRLAPGVSRAEAIRTIRPISGRGGTPLSPTVPAEIDRVRRIDNLPVALAAFVAVVALFAVGFALVTAVRRRRRELAILKTLGFERRQVRATVAWHATIVAAIGVVIGIPLGLIVGRWVWRAVADELGVSGDPAWPVVGVLVLVPVVVLLVNLVAAFPARAAARTRPAVVLRSE